jgi:rod shape-determining protein MreC
LKNPIAIIIAIVLLAVSFLVFTNTPVLVKSYLQVKGVIGELAGPALMIADQPVQFVTYLFDTYIDLASARKENRVLKKKVEALELENQKITLLENENKRLKTILKLSDQNPETMIAARVIGEDVRNWFKCIIIDKGRGAGVKEKMPVVTSKGLVGQAVEVSKWHSKVMIINDTNSSVDVYTEGKSTRGILEGTGESLLKLKYVVKNDEIAIGDKLLTSGKDGIFPKGLPTGIVITVNRSRPGIFADIDVMPFNNFKRLDEVLIVTTQ